MRENNPLKKTQAFLREDTGFPSVGWWHIPTTTSELNLQTIILTTITSNTSSSPKYHGQRLHSACTLKGPIIRESLFCLVSSGWRILILGLNGTPSLETSCPHPGRAREMGGGSTPVFGEHSQWFTHAAAFAVTAWAVTAGRGMWQTQAKAAMPELWE